MQDGDQLIYFGCFTINVTEEVVYKAGHPEKLGPIPYRLLIALIGNHGNEVEQKDLREAGWPGVVNVEADTIYVHIRNLRRLLGNGYIYTGSRGYIFSVDVPIERRVYRVDAPSVTNEEATIKSVHPGVDANLSYTAPVFLPMAVPNAHWARMFFKRKQLVIGLVVALAVGCVAGLLSLGRKQFFRRQPSRFTIEGRLLTVSDAHNRRVFEKILPEIVAPTRVSETEGWAASRHAFVDFGENRVDLVLGINGLLYCYRSDSSIAWTYRPGRDVMTKRGRLLAADYNIALVDSLRKPRRDGGQIIVGSHRGPNSLFVVEVLTKDGRKVGEYFHLGWFFAIRIDALDDSEREYIFLSGVDDASRYSSDYGATLVVLDPESLKGQATTLLPHESVLRDIPPAEEKAVVLIKEFAPNPNPDAYCRGVRVIVSGRRLNLYISQGDGQPGAHYFFDQHLKLESISPELRLSNILKRMIPPTESWRDDMEKVLGNVLYVRNGFE